MKFRVEDLEKIVENYFSDISKVVEHQIKSFNHFVEKRMPYVLLEKIGTFESKTTDLKITFRDIKFTEPRLPSGKPMYPIYCRLTEETYAGDIIVTMDVQTEGKEHTETLPIGKFPVMLRSCVCWLSRMKENEIIELAGEDPLDPGGYFIINGVQRVIVPSIDIGDNRIIVRKEGSDEKTEYIAEIFSQGNIYKNPLLPINELSPRGKTTITLKSSSIFYIDFPRLVSPVPLIPVIRFLGITSDQEIYEAMDIGVGDSALIIFKNLEKYPTTDKDQLYHEIGKYMLKLKVVEDIKTKVDTIIDKFLLPHIGTDESAREEKARVLLFMARKILELKYGLIQEKDKDHLMNKKVKTVSKLLEMIFEDALRHLLFDLENQVNGYYRRHGSIKNLKVKSVLRQYIFTNSIQSNFALGTWPDGATGISQFMHIYNRAIIISILRKIKAAHLNKKLAHFEVRDFHGTHFGRIDPANTPEGAALGLVLNLALFAQSTEGLFPEEDKKVLEEIKKLMGMKK